MKQNSKNGVNVLNLMPEMFSPKFKFLISTRAGGVSKPPYDSLNLSFNVGDKKEDVVFNREKFFDLNGFRENNIAKPEQTHGEKIAEVKTGVNLCFPATDALITREKGVVLSVMTADCLPIMVFDVFNQIIVLIHSGWRGTLLFLAYKTVKKMKTDFNTKARDCYAVLGPAICSNCYSINNDLADKTTKAFNGREIGLKRKNGKIYFDLVETNTILLRNAGLKSENIYPSNFCTSCQPALFFSHRRDYGETGRMMSLAWME
ncbi:MAG: peptidoglycan editing factor PgeF [bacterium]